MLDYVLQHPPKHVQLEALAGPAMGGPNVFTQLELTYSYHLRF